jgi:hypothetical protein
LKAKGGGVETASVNKRKRPLRMRSLSCPSEEPSLSSSSRSPPPPKKTKKNEGDGEDHMCPEFFTPDGKKLLSRLQVRFADGELERLGIVNL